ncbi:MAG: YmfQ family protein [Methylibium sp.]
MTIYDYTYVRSDDDSADVYFGDDQVIWSVNMFPDAPPAGYELVDYEHLLASLLPQGSAWPRESTSVLRRLLDALAAELFRVDSRSVDLLAESDPRLASELLEEWERMVGLPDPCVTEALGVQARRAAVESRLTSVGGQSRAFFMELASRLGYSISIDEFASEAEAIAGGIPYTGTSWAHTWRVNAPEQTVRTFRVGEACAGEPLRSWGNEQLECAFNRLKPAHTVLLFAYA